MNKLDTVAFFEGIAGLTLGLENTGKFETVVMVENAPDRRRVLKTNYPNVPLLGNIETVRFAECEYEPIYHLIGGLKSITLGRRPKAVVGGFPCQGHSVGGKKKGQKDARSALWKGMHRLTDDIHPDWVIIENVERLRKTGLGIVLADLAKIGYDAEWHCITARSVGVDHQRDRLFLIAYPCGIRRDNGTWEGRQVQANEKRKGESDKEVRERCLPEPGTFRSILSRGAFKDRYDANANKRAIVRGLRRVTDGIPEGVDEIRRRERIEQLGNAIVPDIPEIIGNAIWEVDNAIY